MRSEASKEQRRAYARRFYREHKEEKQKYDRSEPRKAYLRKYYTEHKDEYRARERETKSTDPVAFRKAGAARVRAARLRDPLKARFQSLNSQCRAKGIAELNMTLEEFRSWWEKQDRTRCHIDGRLFTREGDICIDHDHRTGRPRGLLCRHCNTGLRFYDEPRLAQAVAAYLART